MSRGSCATSPRSCWRWGSRRRTWTIFWSTIRGRSSPTPAPSMRARRHPPSSRPRESGSGRNTVSKTDWEQIQELLSRYARTLDGKDYAGIADCFTADAEADYPGFATPLKGHDEILGHMRRALEPLAVT